MNATVSIEKKKFSPLFVHIPVSLMASLLFCYAICWFDRFDRVSNDDELTIEPGMWWFFLTLSFFIVIGQTITHKWIFKKFDEDSKLIVSSLIGIPIGFLILFIIFIAWGAIFYLLK